MKHRPALAVLAALVFLLCAIPCSAKIIYVKWDSPGPTLDGSSWSKAYHTIVKGRIVAAAGDEVWVARGTYVECFSLKDGVAFYGGFAGTETARDQRDIGRNISTIDGTNNAYAVVTAPTGLTTTARLDGFTLTRASIDHRGVINCTSSSPTIVNNTITGNVGPGIYISSASPVITNNRIADNRTNGYGGGIYCTGASSAPTITGNVITRNTATSGGGGIRCAGTSAIIANNTMMGNRSLTGGAISGAGTITGNVIMANSADTGGGIDASGGTVTNNLIIGNACTWVGEGGGGMYIAGSPNVANNTIAYNTSIGAGGGVHCATANARPNLSNNIVAFNSSGMSNYQAFPILRNNCVYGNTAYDYSSLSPGTGDISADPLLADIAHSNYHIQPTSPCRNVGWNSAPGIPSVDMDNQARVQDTTVDIGADESDGTLWTVGPNSIIRVSPDGSDWCDGSSWALAKRSIQAAIETAPVGAEVWVKAGTYNGQVYLYPGAYFYGGFAGTETLRSERNWATNKTIIDGGGVSTNRLNGSPKVNAVDGFTIKNSSIGISGIGADIANNTVSDMSGVAISCTTGAITNNTVEACALGIQCGGSVTVTNNTIVHNGDGIDCLSSSPVVSNNIVASNTSGIKSTGGTPVLRNNCVYGNTSYNYSGVSAGTGDISVDPLLADPTHRNFHIQPTSPCRNAGWNSAPALASADIDSELRIQDGTVDIGSDESDGTTWPVSPPVIVRVSPSGNDSNDGSSWALAKRTLQAAIDTVSALGGEVWVKTGIYNGCISCRSYTHLYGGFAGTESARSQRNWTANPTVLDAGALGPAISIAAGHNTNAIDGFTIRNGKNYGIYCSGASPTIANNLITDNAGCGVSIGGGSPTITNNRIIGNRTSSSGGGIVISYSPATITNNIIAGNIAGAESSGSSGGAILCSYSNAVIANNTIVHNGSISGSAVACGGDSYAPRISNNIIAFNSAGIENSAASPVLQNNCVYGNASYNYSGIPAGTGDISADPLLADKDYANFHVQPGSPCINAGDDSVVASGWLDIDDQARIQGAHVDIGADESNGNTWTAGPYAIVRVSPSGNDSSDGSSWSLAKKTVQAGIYAAAALGGEVWVQAGTYNERITVPSYAYIYGGFAGTESTKSVRNWSTNQTIIDGQAGGPVVTLYGGPANQLSTIDGFAIRNGSASTGAGIYCWMASPDIVNNTITGCSASYQGGAMYCSYSSPKIANNTITGNTSGRYGAAGIHSEHGTTFDITNNNITGNQGTGIYLASHSAPYVTRNTISGNTNGGIAIVSGAAPTIAGNLVIGNSRSSDDGAGIFCSASGAVKIVNNTIVGNSVPGGGGGIFCSYSPPAISGNIVAFNSSGILRMGGTPVLRNNDVFGNTSYNYSGLSAGVGDISADPLFVSQAGGDYHLTAVSPCRNTGWNDAPGLPSIDFDGESRISEGTVDIGADEYCVVTASLSAAKSSADGTVIVLQAFAVSAAFDGFFYIEADDKSCGIRVDKSAHGVVAGNKAIISGTLATNADGERYIAATSVAPAGTGSINAILLPNRSVGGGDSFYNPATGAGQRGETGSTYLSNIGLLVATAGKVTYVGSGFFYLDDGSHIEDGSGHVGVRVNTEGQPMPTLDSYVKVTGASSCYKRNGNLYRLIRATGITPVM